MCGIIGILSENPIQERLVQALKRLEYRGYDSSGIVVGFENSLNVRRSVGKICELEALLEQNSLPQSFIGLGHTRWATHGKVTVDNAHPHSNEKVAVVHNGIIENFSEIKALLIKKGYVFQSDTDTEVVVHLLTDLLNQGLNPLEALTRLASLLKGAFALGVMMRDSPNHLYALRRGSPLVVGVSEKDLFLSSDAWALSSWCSNFCYMEDGDIVVFERGDSLHLRVYSAEGHIKEPILKKLNLPAYQVSKGDYQHYMLKEIFEQSQTLRKTLDVFMDPITSDIRGLDDIPWSKVERLRIIACGTSYYAGMVAQYVFEKCAKVPTVVEIASEFRYRSPVMSKGEWGIVISQSGETVDTLEALLLMKRQGCSIICIVNVAESVITRESDVVLTTQAGPERGVASTKSFTSQILILLLMALRASGVSHGRALSRIPEIVGLYLDNLEAFQPIVSLLAQSSNVLFVGRGPNYPLALEGALKLKEVSYIHASAYAAGELKHGPIALVDEHTPIIALIPQDEWFGKTLLNLQEILSRGGRLVCITSEQGSREIMNNLGKDERVHFITLPETTLWESCILYALPLQFLAYFVGLALGTDIDQPRNLAKSVTVE